jgi:hypothetical protein
MARGAAADLGDDVVGDVIVVRHLEEQRAAARGGQQRRGPGLDAVEVCERLSFELTHARLDRSGREEIVPCRRQNPDGEYAPGRGDVLCLVLAEAIKVQGEYVFAFYNHVVPHPVDNKHVRVSRATAFFALEF